MERMSMILTGILTLSTILYWWVGKVYFRRRRGNHWMLLWNPTAAKILVAAPIAGFASVVALGFAMTGRGWWFFGAVIAVFVFFAPGAARVR